MARPVHSPRRRQSGRLPEPVTGAHEGLRLSKVGIAWTLLFAAAVGALIWKHHAHAFLSWTDEQIHFYVAHRMAQGAVLYRDIDSARPPLVLLPLVWLIGSGSSPLFAGRVLTFGFQLATAGLLLWSGWRLASRRAGVLAALLFLTSPDTFERIHYTGIPLVALTASACLMFSIRAQPFRAGLFFGLSMAADQHGLVVCSVAALLTIVRHPRDVLPFALGAIGIGAIIFGGVWVAGGRHLWDNLIGIHLFHLRIGQGVSAQFWQKFTPWICEHIYLFVGAGLAAVFQGPKSVSEESGAGQMVLGGTEAGNSLRAGGGETRPSSTSVVRLLLFAAGMHLMVVLAMSESVFIYVVVIAPLLPLLAGMGFDAILVWWGQRRKLPQARARRASQLVLVGAVMIVVLTMAGWTSARSRREDLDHRSYSFWPHLRSGQVDRLLRLDPILREISESMLPKDGTVFGDSTLVSALALHSGRRVSGELADLNHNWIEAGTVNTAELVSRIEGDGVTAVFSPPWGLVQIPAFKSYLFACYEKPKPFFPPPNGPGSGHAPFFLVFNHRKSTVPCQVP